MVGTPKSGSRQEQVGQMASGRGTPRGGAASSNTSGRMTPVRVRPGEGNFISANAAFGYETPTNKILTSVPPTVTNRSSERRRRMKTHKGDEPGSSDKALGAPFVDSKFMMVKTSIIDSDAPRLRERSHSNASVKSENGLQPHKLTKVSSFSSDRPLTTSLKPTNKKENFFHAKDYKENRRREDPEMFFVASNTVKIVPTTSASATQRPTVSTSSNFSSFSTANNVYPQTTLQYSVPPLSHPLHQPRSPISPTKASFFHVSGSPAPVSSTTQKSTPPSPLRSEFATVRTPSPAPKETFPPPSQEAPNEPSNTSNNSSSSSTNFSGPPEIISDTSEDDLTTKSLLPSTKDLEDSARINRKIADLEISNASLLAVNKNLERLTREQSIEIRALRKQLRQSLRLSAIGPRSPSPLEDTASEDEAEDGDEEIDDSEIDFRTRLDKSIFLTEQMLVEGRRGFEYQVRKSELLTGRVLSGEWKDDLS